MFEQLVGLEVSDEATYAAYRAEMAPLLTARGGRIRHDFRVSETLTTEADAPINRVFVIAFPNATASAAFFADPSYRAIRAARFEPSVASASILASYQSEIA